MELTSQAVAAERSDCTLLASPFLVLIGLSQDLTLTI